MRESIGGAFLFNLVLVFLGVYVAILAFAVVYARAFNTKNHVITLLEQYEGYENAVNEIDKYMATRSGGITGVDGNYCCEKYTEIYQDDCTNKVKSIQGGCIFEFKDNTSNSHYYVVTTFMRVDIPVINALSRFWPISGETNVMYYRGNSNSQSNNNSNNNNNNSNGNSNNNNNVNIDHYNQPPSAEITDPQKPPLVKE